ncbi:MAG: PspC domain-containing protein [Candidatus Hydrogenedens sp.]
MVITYKQETIINKYLTEVNTSLNSSIDIENRKKILLELKTKIISTLKKNGKNYIHDEELYKILYEEFGEPALQAEKLLHLRNFSQELTLDYENRIWLGVCAGLSARIRIPVLLTRILFSILGLCFGIGFIIYLSFYFYLYFSSGIYSGKKIHWGLLIYQLILTLFLLSLVYCIAFYLLQGIELLHSRWVSYYNGNLSNIDKVYTFIFMSFLFYMWTGILSAIMGGLPLRNDWDKTFRNIRDAQIALLVIFESVGIAWVVYHLIVESIAVFRSIMI